MLTISDIIALAKNGYKPADIRELLSIEVTEPSEVQAEELPEDQAENQPADDMTKEQPEDDTDYKALYLDTLEKLNKAQEQNIKNNIESNIDIDKEIEDVFRQFMN